MKHARRRPPTLPEPRVATGLFVEEVTEIFGTHRRQDGVGDILAAYDGGGSRRGKLRLRSTPWYAVASRAWAVGKW